MRETKHAGATSGNVSSKDEWGPRGPHFYFLPPVGFGRVSTTVVEGLRIASETGMYCPVLASRPILLVAGFLAISMAPFDEERSCWASNLPGGDSQQLHHIIGPPIYTTYRVRLLLFWQKRNMLCMFPSYPQGDLVFFLLYSFYSVISHRNQRTTHP